MWYHSWGQVTEWDRAGRLRRKTSFTIFRYVLGFKHLTAPTSVRSMIAARYPVLEYGTHSPSLSFGSTTAAEIVREDVLRGYHAIFRGLIKVRSVVRVYPAGGTASRAEASRQTTCPRTTARLRPESR